MMKLSPIIRGALISSLFLLVVMFFLGLFSGVGIWFILKRIIFFVPVFFLMVMVILSLFKKWGEGAEEFHEMDNAFKTHKTERYLDSENQASNLGRSLDMKDTSDPMVVEPEKAAKVIRKMLSEEQQ